MEPAIVVADLVKRYGTRTALAGIGFTVGAGEVVGLLGPNGAGKSTTLAILATLLAPDAGTVRVAGHALPARAHAVRRVLGLVPQQVALYPTLTAAENLAFFGRMAGLGRRSARDAADRALAIVGLEDRAREPVACLSGGMRRRLNLACGIFHAPRVVLLDEATVGVDPQSRERILDAVQALAREGAAVLYCTHLMEEAERLCARVVLLDDGRVVAAGTPGELVASLGAEARIRMRTARPLPRDWLAGVAGARLVDGAVAAEPGAVSSVLLAATRAGGEVTDLTLHRPNLADVFFSLTGRALRDEAAPDGAG